MIDAPELPMLGGYQIEYARPLYGVPRGRVNETQSGKIHPDKLAIRGNDLDALGSVIHQRSKKLPMNGT
jgi:hypothetical protein